MKTNETPKLKADESAFLTVLVVTLLIIVPCLPLGKYGGGIVMLAGSVLGLIGYILAFGKRLRSRGQLKAFVIVTVSSFALSTAMAITLVLTQWHWH